MRKVDPPAIPKQKTKIKPGKVAKDNSMSMSNKLQNTPANNTITSLTYDTTVSLPPLDYNIVMT